MRTRDIVLGGLVVGGLAGLAAALAGGGKATPSGPSKPTGGGVSGEYWPPDGPVAPAGPTVPGLPAGKGVFVRSVKHGGPVDLFVKRAVWLGLDWVMLQCAWQYAPNDKHPSGLEVYNNPEQLAEYADALREAGIRPWLFGWPRPESGKRARFIAKSQNAAELVKPCGLVINPEKPWYSGKRDVAAQFVGELRDGFPTIKLGMTSYGGGPKSHPPFPWEEFAALDFGIPQIYDTEHKLGADYPRRSVQRWTDAGYRCVPAWGASHAHTPRQMADIASRTPLPIGACCWWDLYWILHGSKPDSTPKQRSEFVHQYSIPKVAVA